MILFTALATLASARGGCQMDFTGLHIGEQLRNVSRKDAKTLSFGELFFYFACRRLGGWNFRNPCQVRIDYGHHRRRWSCERYRRSGSDRQIYASGESLGQIFPSSIICIFNYLRPNGIELAWKIPGRMNGCVFSMRPGSHAACFIRPWVLRSAVSSPSIGRSPRAEPTTPGSMRNSPAKIRA